MINYYLEKNKIIRKTVIRILLIILANHTFLIAQPRIYSIDDLLDISKSNNFNIKTLEKSQEANLKQIDYLNRDYLPTLSTSINISQWKYLLPNKQRLLDNSLTDIYADLRLTQLVYDFNRNNIQKRIVEKSTNIDENNTRRLKQVITYSITRNYFEYLKNKRTLNIQDESLKQLREHLVSSEALYASGKVSYLDVVTAKVQIEIILDEISKTANNIDIQKNIINGLCGNALQEPFDVVDNSDSLWTYLSNINYTVNKIERDYINDHPELLSYKIEGSINEEERDLLSKEYYPEVHLFGIANVEDGRIFPGNFNWNVGVNLSYTLPILQGGNFQEKIEEKRIRMEGLKAKETAVLQEIETSIKNTIINLENIKKRISIVDKLVQLAKENLTTANIKYSIGKGSSLEVLDAETVLTTSKINHDQIKLDYLISIAELNYLTGVDYQPFNKW